ncbi:hypothetical protein CVT24_006232 [Panaeolus cyanescens]|uniref:Uncharacterized protein n=1 Tax=Panaeolus cyanescens TaxID=181874 RepID=A0A409YEI6_9AGAR|nr:hypothetical protein CVT24_006232 [Panaeolus cyanescens]
MLDFLKNVMRQSEESAPSQLSVSTAGEQSPDIDFVPDSEPEQDLEMIDKYRAGNQQQHTQHKQQKAQKAQNGFTFVPGEPKHNALGGGSGTHTRFDQQSDSRVGPPRHTRKLPTREHVDLSNNEDTKKSTSIPPTDSGQYEDTIRSLTAENEKLKKEVEQQRKAYKFMEREYKDRLESLERRYAKKSKELNYAEDYITRTEKRVDKLKAERDEVVREAKERDALLDTRTNELTAAQAFLTTADACSGSDVINMVQRLNEEVMQLSAYMADLIEDLDAQQLKPLPWEKCVSDEGSREYVEVAVSKDLMAFLRQKGPAIRCNTAPFQAAVQGFLVAWLEDQVRMFCGGEANASFHYVYNQIRASVNSTEPQAVSAKWRAISSQHLMTFFVDRPDGFFPPPVTAAILGLLELAGWRPELHDSDKDAINTMEASLSAIRKTTLEIKSTIKQGILSCDLDLVIFTNSVAFQPNIMTDMYNSNIPGRSTKSSISKIQDKVLCTVAFGLKKSTIEKQENGEYKNIQQMLLKPEVILSSALRSFDAPNANEDVTMVE